MWNQMRKKALRRIRVECDVEASKNLEEGCYQIYLSPKAVGVIRYELMTWLNPLLPDARLDRQWLAA
jgi:hypothetical protein